MVIGIRDWFYAQEGRKAHNYGDRFNLYHGHILGFVGEGFRNLDVDGYFAVEVDEILKETEKAIQLVVDGWKFWCPKSLTNMNLDESRVQELRERSAKHEEECWALAK